LAPFGPYSRGTFCSVDGNRLWGKDLGMPLSLVEWSADARFILFGGGSGEGHVYDASGNAVAKLPLYCNDDYAGALLTAVGREVWWACS
jgi:hypothetical protein